MIDPHRLQPKGRTPFASSASPPRGELVAFPRSAWVRPQPAAEPADERVRVEYRGRVKVYADADSLRAELLGPPPRPAAPWLALTLLAALLAGLVWGTFH